MTAALQPPGTVIAFAGDQPPAGWLVCDGSEVRRDAYPALFNAIGIRHGAGNGTTTFNLPDYRGRFLRGVDADTGRDPDAAARGAAAPGGATGNAVGSVQGSATARPVNPFITDNPGNHTHTNAQYTNLLASTHTLTSHETDDVDATGSEPNLLYSAPLVANGAHTHVVASGGDSETRPNNAYVVYLVRF